MADLETTRQEERDFLLASLDDLEAEYAAGDLDEDDYRSLKSDYTTRAARVIRALDRSTAAAAPVRRDWRRIAIWTVLVVVVASLAGTLIAEFSAARLAGETGSGESRSTVRERLFQAQQLLGTDREAAAAIYDSVLEDEPSSAEALAYRGWLARLSGDLDAAVADLEQALAFDPTYPDALVFGAVVAMDAGDVEAAAAHLATLDSIEVPAFITQLIHAQGLRIRIVEAQLLTGEPDSFDTSGLTVVDVARAADSVLDNDVFRGLQLFAELVSQKLDDSEVLTASGWYAGLIAFRGGDELSDVMDIAHSRLTRALGIDAENPETLVYRAIVGYWMGDDDAARADLAAFDALDAERGDLEALLAAVRLRELLA
ncbi:MAG: hypothetical protein P8J50_08195 [Acidimicrobiales bacterium]|nr:hypothetical protein [Acidimicrobiales bacterium]